MMKTDRLKAKLELLYKTLNKRSLVDPDPLQFLYNYPDIRDREIVGLIASSLAYGRVKQIIISIEKVISLMQPTPYDFLRSNRFGKIEGALSDFKHRFTTGRELTLLLLGIKKLLQKYGSLESALISGYEKDHSNINTALSLFVDKLSHYGGGSIFHLLPSPKRGSACKRLHLYLRWMIRKDEVDPGGWRGIAPSKLVIPLDTHMHNISKRLNLTARRSPDMKTAVQVTREFAKITPADPVKYDFALTRLGIRDDLRIDTFF